MINLIILIFFNTVFQAPSPNLHLPFNSSDIINKISNPIESSNPWLSSSKSGEFLIDTNVAYIPAIEGRYSPAVAFDGTNYLVVWEDTRQNNDIYAARVTPTGDILDSAGILVAALPSYQGSPDVAFGGNNYLVVWRDYRNHPDSLWDVYGARVTKTGQVLDTAGIPIANSKSNEDYPKVASNGTDYLVVWADWNSGSYVNVYGARVSQAGNVLDSSGIAISVTTKHKYTPDVSSDGTNYFVVWADSRTLYHNIYGTRITSTGNVLDSSGILISTSSGTTGGQSYPAIAFDGTNYLVVWEDYRSSSNGTDIYGSRVTTTGNVLDSAGIPISIAIQDQEYPAVTFAGTNYLIAWRDGRSITSRDIYGARVNLSGQTLDNTGIFIYNSSGNMGPALASDGTDYLAVMEGTSLWGAKISQTGNVDTIIPVCSAVYHQYSPAVASDGTDYLAVWQDSRKDPNADIYGARINSAGNVLDLFGIPISTTTNKQLTPALAFGGSNYFVVWGDRCDFVSWGIYGSRVTTTGQVLDTTGILISKPIGGANPAIAFDGTNYFVVWNNADNICGARVSQTGILLDTISIIMTKNPGEYPGYPAVAFDGTNYLVVWECQEIWGERVSMAGNLLDTANILIGQGGSPPCVAFDGTNYLVVWSSWGSSGATRVTPAGQVLDSLGINIPVALGRPEIVFDGSKYVVVGGYSKDGYADVGGVRISPTGIVSDTFSIANQPGHQNSPAIAHGTGSEIFVTYSGWTDSINTHPANTMRIWGKIYPYIGVEENSNPQSLTPNPRLSISPNPAHSSIVIQFSVVNSRDCSLKLFDISGRCVKILVNETQPAGRYNITLNAKDLSTGIYFATLSAGNYKTTKKLILMK